MKGGCEREGKMSNFISGEDLLKHLDIRPFELFNYVKNGLQPFNQFGKPIPPPNIKDQSERLKKIKIQLEENPRMMRLTEGTIEATSPPGSRLRLLGDLQRRYASMNKSLQNEIETLSKELDKIENKYSWSNYELPENEQSAKRVMDSLLKALFDMQTISDIKTNTKEVFISGKELLERWRNTDEGQLLEIIKNGYFPNMFPSMDEIYLKKGLPLPYHFCAWHPSYEPIKINSLENPSNHKKPTPIKDDQVPFIVDYPKDLFPFLCKCLYKIEQINEVERSFPELLHDKKEKPESLKTKPQKQITASDFWTITGNELAAIWNVPDAIIEQFILEHGLPVKDSKTGEIFNVESHKTPFGNTWFEIYFKEGPFNRFLFRPSDVDRYKMQYENAIDELKKENATKIGLQPEKKNEVMRQIFREAGKKGGKKPKKNQPILLAIIQYLQKHPNVSGKSNYQIAESFKRHVGKNEPIILNFNDCEWDVYFADNYIEAIADATNKKKHKDKSIAYSTFRNSYISEAKKIINKT